MVHVTSIELVKLMDDIRTFLFGLASVGPDKFKKTAQKLIDRIDDAIGR